MSNFWTRTITGLSMVFILLAAIYFSGLVFASIFLLITILGLWEFYGLITNAHCQPQKVYGTFAGAVIYLTTLIIQNIQLNFREQYLLAFVPLIMPIPLLFITFIIEIYRDKPNPLQNISTTILGILYIAVPFSLLLFFSRSSALYYLGMPVILVGYFAFTWIFDTCAYLYGKQFGKHKLFERISPKKTWEGTIAGAIITLITATGLSFLITGLPVYDWLALALIVIVFGAHGDLVESLFKRSLNIKDSGVILPGHGGILDRFDTMLISAPFVFLYFFLRNSI